MPRKDNDRLVFNQSFINIFLIPFFIIIYNPYNNTCKDIQVLNEVSTELKSNPFCSKKQLEAFKNIYYGFSSKVEIFESIPINFDHFRIRF